MTHGATAYTHLKSRWSWPRVEKRRIVFQVDDESGKRRATDPECMGVRVDDGTVRLQVERIRSGESTALGALLDAFRPDILRLCMRMLGPVDAEDAANESFERAHLRFEHYDSGQSLGRWLRAIAAHHCVDRLRRRNLEKRLFENFEPEFGGHSEQSASALDELIQTRRQSALRAALDSLPDKHRAPLVLRYFAELDYDAIGEELGLSRSQVATSLFRAKQQLRGMLRAEQGGTS